MPKKVELKPCPFCGKPAEVVADLVDLKRTENEGMLHEKEVRVWWVECNADKCWTSGPHRRSKRAAIRAWNNRRAAEEGD